MCLFYIRSFCKTMSFPCCNICRQTDCYYLCHTDIYRCGTGCTGKHNRRISWLWIYKSVHTGLYYDLLQKLYNGSSGTAFYCRPDSKSGFQKNIQIDIIFFKSWFIWPWFKIVDKVIFVRRKVLGNEEFPKWNPQTEFTSVEENSEFQGF